MKLQVSFRPKIILVLLLTGIAMNAFSAFFFFRLDQVVHVDLYRYGLQFNYEWTTQYWSYSRLLMGFLAIAMAATGISAVFILIHAKTHGFGSRFISCLFLLIGIVASGSSAFFFNRLDYIVNNDLYKYGLQFNSEWALQYWTYARLMLESIGLAIATTGICTMLILRSSLPRETYLFPSKRSLIKIDPKKLTHAILFSAGVVALAFSIYHASSILAFIGLGLVFWAALLLYVTPTKHIKLELLNATTSSTLTNIEKVIANTESNAKGIYLPPKYLKDFESSLIFIPSKAEQPLPKPEEVEEKELYSKSANGIFMTPPGLALSKLFEKELGTSFIKTDLTYIQEKLPKLFIEDMEIAENIDVLTENNTITIKMKNHIFKDVCEETRKHQKLHEAMGCPLCSAVACALAKATGKPISIEKEEQSRDGKTTKIQYHILEE